MEQGSSLTFLQLVKKSMFYGIRNFDIVYSSPAVLPILRISSSSSSTEFFI